MKIQQSIFFILLLIGRLCNAADTNSFSSYEALAAQTDAPFLVLSEETNSLKVGLYIDNTNHVIQVKNGEVISEVDLAMLNTSADTNYLFYNWYKNPQSAYDISMTDSHGNAVPKTALGKSYGQPQIEIHDNPPTVLPLSIRARKLGLAKEIIFAKGDFIGMFDFQKNLLQCFDLEKPGNYKFTLVFHGYVPELHTNGYYLKPITFSPVTVDVVVQTNSPAK